MRKLKKILLLILLAGITSTAFAQTTGKITGFVLDEQGLPLPGVNVFIEGTTLGGGTDGDGEYVILAVRPGRYTIVASFIGFSTQKVSDVSVSVDLTSRINFTMREEVYQGEEIVVVAQASSVRKDMTSSEARVSAESIDNLPVQELSQVLNVQAGITTDSGGGIHIRGGRSSEVVYMVDGVAVTDSYDGSAALQVETDGIEELQVISGTFNAEYGNALSGIINVVTKEGRSDRWGGSFNAYSGSYIVGNDDGSEAFLRGLDDSLYVRSGSEYRDVDPYGYLEINPLQYSNTTLSIEGPILGNKLTFFGLGRFFKNDGWFQGVNLYDIDGTSGDSSLVNMNPFQKVSWQGNIKWQINSSMFLNIIGLGSVSESQNYSHGWRWAPNGRPTNRSLGYDTKLRFTHIITSKTFYTFAASSFFKKATSYTFEDPLDARYNDFASNAPDSVEITPGVWETVQKGGFRFLRGGTDNGHFERSTQAFLTKFDITSQIHRNHQVKLGFSGRLDLIELSGYGLVQNPNGDGTLVVPEENSVSFQKYIDVNPITVSGYIQDKIEYESIIINAGLRLDYFDSRATVLADPSDPNIYSPFKATNRFNDTNGDGIIDDAESVESNAKSVADREAYWYKDATAKFQLSPRLGVSYPITTSGIIRFSYGHFLQIPTMDKLFQNFGYKIRAQSGTYGPFGNADLDAQKTVLYEIGFRQEFGDFVVDGVGFYRDVRDWVDTSVPIETEQPGVSYVVYINRAYGNTRGATLTLSKKFSDHYSFDVNYTFQVVEGSASNPNEEFFASQGGAEPSLTLIALDWDQRHKVALSTYVGGDTWGSSLLAIIGSGFPYTPSFPQASNVGADVPPAQARNARRKPNSFQVDLSAYKSFKFGNVEPRLTFQVFNLLDARTINNVYSDTGRPNVTQQSTDADPGVYVHPEFYSEPRRIQVGIDFRF